MELTHKMFKNWRNLLIICLSVTLLSGTAIAKKKDKEEKLPIEDVQRFTIAISQIKNFYVEPVKDQDLFEDAIRGMLQGLDPHSSYLDKQDFQDLRAATKGEFSGLGIEVTMEDGYIKVISPIDDTPAYIAGVKSGDLIIKLDDKPVKGMTLRDAVNNMRGKRGTKILLTILRKGEKKPLRITVKRDVIHIKSVKSRLIDKKYAYVRVGHFQSPTTSDMLKAIKKLKKEAGGKLAGLVLDLRNNPGGLLDSAIQVSDAFIHNDKKGDEELIVYTKGRLPSSQFTATATPGDLLDGAPIIVLVNGGSASGSEIVAGALQDHKRAIVIGTKTFGKGSVQTVLPLDNDRGIKLTTALYYTPEGRSIQATGIVPDIIVEALEIPKPEEDKIAFDAISEADLSGHLANGNIDEKSDKKAKTDKEKDKELVHTDYQLYEAINLLKGLALVKS